MVVIVRIAVSALIVLVALVAVPLGRAPIWLPVAYLIMGMVSIGFYCADKAAAQGQRWRTPEATLHGIDLAGGIAGGLVAQALLRHKTRKPGFVATTALIALGHLAALLTLLAGLWSLPALG